MLVGLLSCMWLLRQELRIHERLMHVGDSLAKHLGVRNVHDEYRLGRGRPTQAQGRVAVACRRQRSSSAISDSRGMGGQGRGGRPCRRLWRPRGRRGRRGRRWAEEGKVESRCGRRTHTLERRHCFHATSPSPAPISPHPLPTLPSSFARPHPFTVH